MRRLLNTPDGQSGLFFVVLGLAMGMGALQYPLGTLSRMGPGFFPLGLSSILVALGIVVCVQALRQDMEVMARFDIRATVFIIGSLVLSGIVLGSFGLFPAIVVLSVVGSLAAFQPRWRQVMAVTIAMAVMAYVVFIYGLGLRIPLLAY